MISITTNIMSLLLAVGVWVIDGCLFLITLRFVAHRVASSKFSESRKHLAYLTEPFTRPVVKWLRYKGNRSPSQWLIWPIVVVGLINAKLIAILVLMALERIVGS